MASQSELHSGVEVVKRLKGVLDRAVNVIAIGIAFAMVLFTFLQVVGRYVFASPPSWTEELSRYLSVWLIFLGAAIAFRTGAHLGLDFFIGLVPPRVRRIVQAVVQAALVALLLLFVVRGFGMVGFVSRQLSPAMRISMGLPYAAIPVGCGLMALEVLFGLVFRADKGR